MSDSSDRLDTEFADIKQQFTDHPQISIVSTNGSPVNQYVVEYRLNGLVQLDDGQVVQSDQHRIEINLSFGFPHFPPNCKPLTTIFHPDIDPSAIKIAEFWSDATSLCELILYIGRMICWQSYSAENGFNQAALDWLAEHKDAVPMDSLGGDSESAVGSELPDIDLGASSEMPELSLDLTPDAEPADVSGVFVDEIDFNFESPASKDDEHVESEPVGLSLDIEPSPELELSLDEGPVIDLDLGLGGAPDNNGDSFVDDLDFNFSPSGAADSVELSLDDVSAADEAPLELSLENEDIKPEEKEEFSFVAASAEEDSDEDANIVVEQVAIEEPDLTPSFPEEELGDVDLDLAVVDVDYDIFKGMIDQRNYIAAQTKFATMPPENISKASAVLRPMVDQRIKQADGVHGQARKLEDEGLLEDAAKKFEAVMNLVQDYPNLEEDMKRVRDAWAGVGTGKPVTPASNLGLDRAGVVESAPMPVRDTILSQTVVPSAGESASDTPPASASAKKKKGKAKKQGKDSFIKQKQNKPIIIAALGLVLALCLSGWIFMEWQAFSDADRKWGEINALLENNEYQNVKAECLEIRELLDRVKIIMGGGKKELLERVDDLLSSEHFLEGFEGKIYWQGQYISKKAHRAYTEINDLVEEAERRGALSKWQNAADLYGKAFKIAEDNRGRLDNTFYDDLALNVKNATFANLVSQGKAYFIGSQWPQAIEKFEMALKLASEDGVADPSTSYDVNRYLQRAWFSQYVIDGNRALQANDMGTAFKKFTKAYAIAGDPNLIDDESRQQVLVKLNQSSLIKLMAEAEGYVANQQWKAAVASYKQAKTYTMGGYPLIDMDVQSSQRRVEGLLVSSIVSKEREVVTRKRGAGQYVAAEAALDRIIAAIDASFLKGEPALQKIRRKAETDKKAVHLKGVVEEKIAYLLENYRQIVSDNFTGVSLQALSNVKIDFLGQDDRALQFKIQCREQRESKYYTLELIYQYDLDLEVWGFPSM